MGEELAAGDTPTRRSALERVLNYFLPHMNRIDYAGRLASGDAIGSGSGGCGEDVGDEAEGEGARWRHRNARAMAALICCRHTDQWGLFWKRKE